MSAAVSIRGLGHVFGEGTAALDGVDLSVPAGAFVAIVGPSGCGKTTLLQAVAGLLAPTRGSVTIGGRPAVECLGDVAYLSQRDCLMPWRTVAENAAVGLELQGVSRRDARAQAREACDEFGLAGFADAPPSALSGGMRQRVALLRTLLAGPSVAVLDEPFGALDALTRRSLQRWLLGVTRDGHMTTLLVTHDVAEAAYLADAVYVLSARPGRLVAVVDTPGASAAQRDRDAPEVRAIEQRLLSLLEGPSGAVPS